MPHPGLKSPGDALNGLVVVHLVHYPEKTKLSGSALQSNQKKGEKGREGKPPRPSWGIVTPSFSCQTKARQLVILRQKRKGRGTDSDCRLERKRHRWSRLSGKEGRRGGREGKRGKGDGHGARAVGLKRRVRTCPGPLPFSKSQNERKKGLSAWYVRNGLLQCSLKRTGNRRGFLRSVRKEAILSPPCRSLSPLQIQHL